jgi:hypothetical protein
MIPEGHRFEATQALRQVLSRAVAWGLLDSDPAKRGVPNQLRRSKEKRPFESWQQIDAIAEGLSPVYGPMIRERLGGPWTLGGRRRLKPSLVDLTEGPD